MFKSYSPLPALPPGCAGNEVEGGKKHTNRQTISGGGKESRSRAEAWSKHFQRHFLIEKICFHCSVISEYVREGGRERERIALSWGDEEMSLQMVSRVRAVCVWVKQKRKWQNESFSTDGCNQGWPPSWLLRGQTVHNINPTHGLTAAVSVFPKLIPHLHLTHKCSGSFLLLTSCDNGM